MLKLSKQFKINEIIMACSCIFFRFVSLIALIEGMTTELESNRTIVLLHYLWFKDDSLVEFLPWSQYGNATTIKISISFEINYLQQFDCISQNTK